MYEVRGSMFKHDAELTTDHRTTRPRDHRITDCSQSECEIIAHVRGSRGEVHLNAEFGIRNAESQQTDVRGSMFKV